MTVLSILARCLCGPGPPSVKPVKVAVRAPKRYQAARHVGIEFDLALISAPCVVRSMSFWWRKTYLPGGVYRYPEAGEAHKVSTVGYFLLMSSQLHRNAPSIALRQITFGSASRPNAILENFLFGGSSWAEPEHWHGRATHKVEGRRLRLTPPWGKLTGSQQQLQAVSAWGTVDESCGSPVSPLGFSAPPKSIVLHHDIALLLLSSKVVMARIWAPSRCRDQLPVT